MKNLEIDLSEIINQADIQEELHRRALETIREAVNYQLEMEVRQQVKQVISDNIQTAVDATFTGAIMTNDGWGKKENFPSFDDMFKVELKKALSSYNIAREAQTIVKAQVEKLMADNVKVLSAAMLRLTDSPEVPHE